MSSLLVRTLVIGHKDDINGLHHVSKFDTNSSATLKNSESGGVIELHCSSGDLLGPFGLFVQGLLAFLAFTCLIGKHVKLSTA